MYSETFIFGKGAYVTNSVDVTGNNCRTSVRSHNIMNQYNTIFLTGGGGQI